MYAKDGAPFAETGAPAWVSDWLQSREQRSEKKAAKLADTDTTPEQAAAKAAGQQKRQDKRESNVAAGLDLFDTWLADLARDGVASLRAKPAKDWEAIAARLVDAQAPGLAGRLRRTGLHVYASSAPDWEATVGRELAQAALLSQSYRRLALLPAPLQCDIRSALGWTTTQEEALAEPGHADTWLVCGSHTQDDERVSRRATYLRGRASGRWGQLLQYSAGSQALGPALPDGAAYEGTLHYYPSANPLRAVAAADWRLLDANPPAPAPAAADVGALLEGYARALAANPFLDSYPMCLDDASFAPLSGGWGLRCADGAGLAIDGRFRHGWQCYAVTGAAPANVFGLWSGYAFLPLAMRYQGRVYGLDREHV